MCYEGEIQVAIVYIYIYTYTLGSKQAMRSISFKFIHHPQRISHVSKYSTIQPSHLIQPSQIFHPAVSLDRQEKVPIPAPSVEENSFFHSTFFGHDFFEALKRVGGTQSYSVTVEVAATSRGKDV